jgi:D-beta-D-heptose 7-phosphate kinase/D-beta-D-heptose 1-phosphate adenosyltransferase
MSRALLRLIGRFSSKRILVLGEAMLDSYVLGASTRLCQEAPAPVVAVHERRDCPGGAANTAVNLAALGCRVDLISVVGADHEGERLRALLRRHGVGGSLLAVSEARQTLSKQRIVNGGRLLARVDQGDTGPISGDLEQRLLRQLDVAFTHADAVVISDYGYGVMTSALLGHVRRLQERFRQVISVDARNLARYRPIGVTVVKPNYGEALRLAGAPPPPADAPRAMIAAELGGAVRGLSGARIAAITQDAHGAVVVERGRPSHRTVAVPADQARTAGAGDTYLAAFTLALASGADTPEAAEIAACAADVVVSRDGTAACGREDLVGEIMRAAGASPAADKTIVEGRDGRGDSADLGQRRAPALHQA